MTLSRDGMLCDQAAAATASIFNYTIAGLAFQGRPLVSDGSSWWLYMGTAGGRAAAKVPLHRSLRHTAA